MVGFDNVSIQSFITTMTVHDIKERLLSRSYLLFRLKRWRNLKHQRFVKDDTTIVIEGYPRSANSLMVDAFIIAQTGYVPIANHSHHWGQVKDGVKKGIPVVVTIRNPIDAAASLLVRRDEINAQTALSGYDVFHRKILPLKKQIQFVRFEDVIESPAQVVAQINERFSTCFEVPEDTVKDELRDKSLKESSMKDPEKGKFQVCYPNKEKAERVATVKEQLRIHPMASRVEELYRRCLGD